MARKLTNVTGKEAIKAFAQIGFHEVRKRKPLHSEERWPPGQSDHSRPWWKASEAGFANCSGKARGINCRAFRRASLVTAPFTIKFSEKSFLFDGGC